MKSHNGGFDPYEIGDRVAVNSGTYIGAIGTIEFVYPGNAGYLIHTDDNQHLAALRSMIDRVAPAEPVVDPLKQGMTSEDLAVYVDAFIREAQARVRGVGDQQYSEGTHQKFEAMHPDELFAWAQEEMQDIAVYAAMLDIRIRRIREALKDHL